MTVRTSRALAREQGAEGRLWPVVLALGLSALVGSAFGWFLLPRTSLSDTAPDRVDQPPAASSPPTELDQRQQLLSRLRALQVDRSWFLQLLDASQSRSESPEGVPLRRLWTEMAEQWLARIEQLPPAIRARLGRLSDGDWKQPRQVLVQQGVHLKVVEHMVSAGSDALLPGSMQGWKPVEPFRQVWIAAAMHNLDDIEIVRLKASRLESTNLTLHIPARGARLVMVDVPAGDALALDINGTPLMQMMVFGANGRLLEEQGPLRAVRIAGQADSPLQVLITNQGVSSSRFAFFCSANLP